MDPLINAYYHVGWTHQHAFILLMDFLVLWCAYFWKIDLDERIFCLASITGNQYFRGICISRYFTVLYLLGIELSRCSS